MLTMPKVENTSTESINTVRLKLEELKSQVQVLNSKVNYAADAGLTELEQMFIYALSLLDVIVSVDESMLR